METTESSSSKKDAWAGRILTGTVTLMILASGVAKMAGAQKMVDGLIHAGIPQAAILPIAVLELSCLALYLIPRTAALGTLLLTGFFGGATVIHITNGESLAAPLIVGLLIWGGAYFRIPEFQALLRKGQGAYVSAQNRQPLPTRR